MKFELKQIKLSHYHFNNGNYSKGMPIITSLELLLDNDKTIKKISHEYIYDEINRLTKINSYEEIINNTSIFKSLELYDLKNLKNNYYTDYGIEKLSHYEINYNYMFKIVGTYDNEINEYKDICDILGFKELINDEIIKAKNMVKYSKND